MLKLLNCEHCCHINLWISIKEKKTELCLFLIYEHYKFKILQAHAYCRTHVLNLLENNAVSLLYPVLECDYYRFVRQTAIILVLI